MRQKTYLPSGAFIIFLLVQLRACRNMVVHHEQVQLLFAVLLAYSDSSIPQDSMPIMALGGQVW